MKKLRYPNVWYFYTEKDWKKTIVGVKRCVRPESTKLGRSLSGIAHSVGANVYGFGICEMCSDDTTHVRFIWKGFAKDCQYFKCVSNTWYIWEGDKWVLYRNGIEPKYLIPIQ